MCFHAYSCIICAMALAVKGCHFVLSCFTLFQNEHRAGALHAPILAKWRRPFLASCDWSSAVGVGLYLKVASEDVLTPPPPPLAISLKARIDVMFKINEDYGQRFTLHAMNGETCQSEGNKSLAVI